MALTVLAPRYPNYPGNTQDDAYDIPGRTDIANAWDYNTHDAELLRHQSVLIGHDGSINLLLSRVDQPVNIASSPTFITITLTGSPALIIPSSYISLNGFIEFIQITTPSVPAATKDRLYFKSDDKLYYLTSAGVETEVGTGAGGTSGYSGYSGYSGEGGSSGYSGLSGYSGSIGASGYSGALGSSGYSGFSGFSGFSSYSGYSGTSGYSGLSGYSGESGYSGYSGSSGYSGDNPGSSGYSGMSGYSGDGDTIPIGQIAEWPTLVAPTGWLLCDGKTIGDSLSGADFQGDVYHDLYDVIRATFGGTYDWANHDKVNLPIRKGRVGVGYDALDPDFSPIGKTGGEKTHILTISELAKHSHDLTDYLYGTGGASIEHGTNSSDPYPILPPTTETGGDQPHNNLQPYEVTNYIIKYRIIPTGLGTSGYSGYSGDTGPPGASGYSGYGGGGAHTTLTDMPDVGGLNSDHDARYLRKVLPSASGNFPAIDASGNLKDSGYSDKSFLKGTYDEDYNFFILIK